MAHDFCLQWRGGGLEKVCETKDAICGQALQISDKGDCWCAKWSAKFQFCFQF